MNVFEYTGFNPVAPSCGIKTYIYFMTADFEQGRLTKIGYSYRPEKRIKALQSKLRRKIKMEALVELKGFYNCQKLELLLHKKLSEYRAFGEWFSPCPEINKLIKTHRVGELQ